MESLKYRVITSKNQYRAYCSTLERLIFSKSKDRNIKDEIALLTLLIEKWGADYLIATELDPIQLLESFIKDHKLRYCDLVHILGVSKGYVSDIMNYKKGLSKQAIRKLADYFKVAQEAFNRPYSLRPDLQHKRPGTATVRSRKKSAEAT